MRGSRYFSVSGILVAVGIWSELLSAIRYSSQNGLNPALFD